ncbi:M17 family peptidase N-terminal domain-containing protein [Vulgatibacter sp.]|uniref:M17 family peptidase N-terminal domain-containing protein n=1 Tax=Vulgatibacter sp. TaxID=1971226 RepID=UPI00356499C0
MKKGLQLGTAPLSLDGLDGLGVPDLVAFVAEDERPLRGLAGLVDWRLCGALTRQVKAEHFAGRAGDALLTVSGGRLPAGRIFLFGVGPSASVVKGRPGAWLHEALDAVARAGGMRIALALPAWGDVPVNVLARALTEAARDAGLEQVVLLHGDERAADRALAVAAETFPGVSLRA